MRDSYLYTDHMSVGYGRRPLIADICLQLRRGEIMTLIGPNGSGKSTVLKSIIRQIAPLGGTVYLDGRSMGQMAAADIAKRLSVLMTDRIHPERMTCQDVVGTGRYPYTGRLGILTEEDRLKVRESLELVHGTALADRDFSAVSDGQRQRILLARALCQEPEIIVLDEPTSFLDIRYKLELLAILKDMVRRRRLSVLLTLHELDLAQKISDYVVCIHNNAIERCGPPEEIFTSEYVMQLYGASRGSYNAYFGCLELEPVMGPPEVFVIGGGGTGIPVYRRLQRKGIPFAAGILHENDLDYPAAKSLAVRVLSAQAYEPIGSEVFRQAAECLNACSGVICCLEAFGTMNQENRWLYELAKSSGKLAECL